jgi:hypothetical protein
MISAFAFVLLPKLISPDRNALPPITVDMFLGPGRKLAAAPDSAPDGRLSASAKRHGLAAFNGLNQAKPGT